MFQFLFIILVFLASALFGGSIWVISQFGNLTFDEILFELSAPLSGTGNGMIGDFIFKCIVIPILVTVITVISVRALERKKKKAVYRLGAMAISILLLVTSSARLIAGTGLMEYISDRSEESSFIEENYVDPNEAEVTFPDEKRNLVMIYLESMEVSFSDSKNGGLMDKNHIPELTALAKEGEDFGGDTLNGGYAMPGCTWTMGGILASSAGVPLSVSVEDNSMSVADSFFPKLAALGDILLKNGYNQYFVLGSDAQFGGRNTYFKDHGSYDIRDYEYAKKHGFIPDDYNEFWGMEDEKLFALAKQTITEAAKVDAPFNVTMLTVDTHFPGYECDLCRDDFPDEKTGYGDALACSSRQVEAFVKWLQSQDFYDDTAIVITGDHPTMEKDYVKAEDDYIRKTYTCVLNAKKTPAVRDARDFTTFDLFPTTLSALGADIEGDRLGLGTDLFSDTPTLSEVYGFADESDELEKRSPYLAKLETLDDEIEKDMDIFSDISGMSVSRKKSKDKGGKKTESYSAYVPDISDTAEEVYSIQVKVFDDDGKKEMRTLKRQDDGSYKLEFSTKSFLGEKKLKYIFYAVIPLTDGEYVTVDLGKEGKVKWKM